MSKEDHKLIGLTRNTITESDILRLQELCYENCRQQELYSLRNSAKLRAVTSTQSYDEFKDIVDAAHLKSLTCADKKNSQTKSRLWNSTAKHN